MHRASFGAYSMPKKVKHPTVQCANCAKFLNHCQGSILGACNKGRPVGSRGISKHGLRPGVGNALLKE